LTDDKRDPVGRDAGRASLELADWRRRIATLYAEVREHAASDPAAAWERWRAVREVMYRTHPQSPVPAAERERFVAHCWPYDPALRFEVGVEGIDAGDSGASPVAVAPSILPVSAGAALDFARAGRITLPLRAGARALSLFWMAGYAGGLFLPFRDATNGRETYGAGRYLLDTAKGADLGGDPASGRLVLDFNFAFQPSCAFDPRWACPLAPPENRLDLPVEAGERIA
jgi:hypothetical protein